MAESDSILQLGIEAARDGNREEARNLFRLLTRQDPSNAQAWLWLAGVAENRDERQVALERVVELDPSNEMAVKGLQALGVRPPVRLKEESLTPTVSTPTFDTEPPVIEPPVTVPSEPVIDRARYDIDDDDPYAALDTLSEAMAEAPTAVRRTETESSDIDALDDSEVGGVPRRSSSTRSTTRNTRTRYDDDEETVPARRGVSPLLIGLVILALVLLLALLLWPLLRGRSGSGGTADTTGTQTEATMEGTVPAAGTAGSGIGGNPTSLAQGTAAPGGATTAPGQTTAVPGGAATAVPGGAATAAPAQPAPPPAAPAAGLEGVNPAIVAANTPQESNGWLYDFNQPTYAAPINGALGNVQPQGRFVVVLAFLANRTGTAQAIPADFFVLKDAQGRVYTTKPDASNVYVQRGINADLSQTDVVPADGLTRSVALIFDVQPDATNLVFFARSKTDQGWQVLSSVR